MKRVHKFLLLAGAALAGVACTPDAESYTAGAPEDPNCVGAYFDESSSKTVEVEPGVYTFEVALARYNSENAVTVDLAVTNNEQNIFTVPSSAEFAAGEEETTITIAVSPDAAVGVEYALGLALTGDQLGNYTDGLSAINISYIQLKWEPVGQGVWVDNTVAAWFGFERDITMYVDIERTETASSTRFRFHSPFAKVSENGSYEYDEEEDEEYWAVDPDEKGIYDAYPYTEEGDLVDPNKNYYITIDVTDEGAVVLYSELGMDWGFGMFYLYASYLYDDETYPAGTYDEAADMIELGGDSILCYMANYGGTLCSTPSYLFLSVDAYESWLTSGDEE